MPKINNTQIFGLDESIFRSGYPMLETAPTEKEFKAEVAAITEARSIREYIFPPIKRAIDLAQAKGGGHDQFLTGITVTFDLTIANKCWVEAERYRFLNFISSMSTMHRVAHFKIGESCNDFVDKKQVEIAEQIQDAYNDIDGDKHPERKKEAYLMLLYNMPSGFELMAGMVTNYRCLKNIWAQRRYHRLPDWHMFCDWIETLPMAKELILPKRFGA
jgi:hypothetical protein